MGKIIGIDLGTTNSCVSVYEGYAPVVIANNEGSTTAPSVVAFMKDGTRKVGAAAKRQAITNPKNTIYSIKRFMGETYQHVKKEIERVPYTVCNKNGFPLVDIDGRKYTPQEISAMILLKMKNAAEDYLGQKVTDAVIAVPAFFSNSQRQATKEAGQIAGLNVLRIVNEPTAAALAYGVDKMDKDMKIAVFDLGGGTLDVSILDFGGGVLEVLASSGDTHLGGDDFDQIIINWLVREFHNDVGADLNSDPMAMQRLKEAAEKAKIELSSTNSTEINLPYIMSVSGVPIHLVKTLTRAKFEQLAHNLMQACLTPCQNAVHNAGINVTDIDEVLLVGGSCRIPAVQKLVKGFFGKRPLMRVNTDNVVAMGAAIAGAINNHEVCQDIVCLDVTPLTLGIETAGGVMTKLIDANTTIPCKNSETFSTAVDNQTEVTIHVLQGESATASQNISLGQFNLTGIAPARKGIPLIEVTFDIDANGILKVSAKDKATGKEQTIRIESNSSLSNDEIDRMRKDLQHETDVNLYVSESKNEFDKSGQKLKYGQDPKTKDNQSGPSKVFISYSRNKEPNPNPSTEQTISSQEQNIDFFISYAHEDYEIASEIATMLRGLGANVWFDKKRLKPGDPFTDDIKDSIETCKRFVPILSCHTTEETRRFFRREWFIAKQEAELRLGMPYITPISIDNVNIRHHLIPSEFSNVHVLKYQDGIEDELKELIREIRRG